MSAAGAHPARMASARTLLLELDPRPDGMATILPARLNPCWGWCGSITCPVARSMPPQKLRGASRRRSSPVALPGLSGRALSTTPEALTAHDPSRRCRSDTLLQAAEHDPDPEVPGRVVGPLPRVRHHGFCSLLQD